VCWRLPRRGLHSAVNGGENTGQDLQHAPVVRFFRKAGIAAPNAAPSFMGESDLKVDLAWEASELLRVVALSKSGLAAIFWVPQPRA